MTEWTCSFYRPQINIPARVVIAETFEEAALDYHYDNDGVGFGYTNYKPDNSREGIRFACIVVTDKDGVIHTVFTRIYHHGIWRKGGVKRPGQLTLADIAKALGYDDDPQTLIEPGWSLEETMEQAEETRKRKDHG